MKLFDFSGYNWIAINGGGSIYLFESKPNINPVKQEWAAVSKDTLYDTGYYLSNINNYILNEEYSKIPWKESLRQLNFDKGVEGVEPQRVYKEMDDVILALVKNNRGVRMINKDMLVIDESHYFHRDKSGTPAKDWEYTKELLDFISEYVVEEEEEEEEDTIDV